MGTIHYPDVSSAQAGMSLASAVAVCAKITQGRGYLNPAYAGFQRQAHGQGSLFFAYHFLEESDAGDQAEWCHKHAGSVPVMVDCEPWLGGLSYPTFTDLLGFIDIYRRLGGVTHLAYLPRWYWSSRLWGSPSLAPLARRGMTLVSSDYVTYSDGGPGWAPYGGVRPGIWQWTESAHWNGRLVDRNAFKGTVGELRNLVTTGSREPSRPARRVEEEDDVRMLNDGHGAESIISFERGSVTWIAFACDASRARRPAPKLRVAAHSNSRGFSQIETVTMPLAGKHTVSFHAKDVDFLAVEREGGDDGDMVAVGYNYG